MKGIRAPLAVLLGLGAVWSCSRKAAEPAPRRVLRLAIDSPVFTLDPTYTEFTTYSVLSNIFEPLVDYDSNLRLVPALATAWTTPDDRTWILKIRSGVRFHDGTAFAAEDAAAALERAKDDPISEVKSRLDTIEDIDVPGPGELRIRTSRPDALLLHSLVPVLVGKGTSRADFERHPIGTGPYRLTRWIRGGATEVEAFAGTWRPPVRISRAVFLPVPAGEARVRGLKDGRLDVATVPAQVVPDKGRGFRIADSPGLTTFYLFLSTQDAAGAGNPLRDRTVRQAMSLAIDRRAVARGSAGHETAFAAQVVPPSIFGYAPALPPPAFDTAAARALLARSHRIPVKLTLVHREGAEWLGLAETLKAMLDAAGFEITLRALAWPDLLEAMSAQRLPLVLSGWQFDNGDAGSFLRDCLRSRHPPSPDGAYNAGYSNPEMDRLIDESAAILDDRRRLEAFEQAVALARQDVPLIPLVNRPDIWGVSNDLEWQPRLDARLLASEMAFREGGR